MKIQSNALFERIVEHGLQPVEFKLKKCQCHSDCSSFADPIILLADELRRCYLFWTYQYWRIRLLFV